MFDNSFIFFIIFFWLFFFSLFETLLRICTICKSFEIIVNHIYFSRSSIYEDVLGDTCQRKCIRMILTVLVINQEHIPLIDVITLYQLISPDTKLEHSSLYFYGVG
uniref:Uncharacterized protein n=1 Tax=Octopus bimaculoides TaxID=37653 RepID=A0A0L8GWA8_OCTBM